LGSGASSVLVKTDSELLAKQMQGKYRVKNRGIIPHFQSCKELASGFERFHIEHVPRAANKRADVLANNAIDAALAKAG
jgi:ribonuclease HI/probable phosphoglycerate mutase